MSDFVKGLMIGGFGVIVLAILIFLVAFYSSKGERQHREAVRRMRAQAAVRRRDFWLHVKQDREQEYQRTLAEVQAERKK